MEIPSRHTAFAEAVAGSKIIDYLPTFEALSTETGIDVEDLVHHALVRWAAAGGEALMAVEPMALRELMAARQRNDWVAVSGIIDWLQSGLQPAGEDLRP